MNTRDINDIFDVTHRYRITVVFNSVAHDVDEGFDAELSTKGQALREELEHYADDDTYPTSTTCCGESFSEYAYDRIMVEFMAGTGGDGVLFTFEEIQVAMTSLMNNQSPFKHWDVKEVLIERLNSKGEIVQGDMIPLRPRP